MKRINVRLLVEIQRIGMEIGVETTFSSSLSDFLPIDDSFFFFISTIVVVNLLIEFDRNFHRMEGNLLKLF